MRIKAVRKNYEKTGDLKTLSQTVLKFAKERGWKKFHTPKNMAMDLVREATELMEHFVWLKDGHEVKKDKKILKAVKSELADVLHSLLVFADSLKIDLGDCFWQKLKKLEKRYPKEKIFGKSGYQFKREK